MSKINIYIKSSFWYILGNGLGLGLTLFSSFIFTRIMSREGYGLYSTYYSAVTILAPVIGANLYNSLANAYFDYKKTYKAFRSSVLFLSTLVFLVLSFFVVIVNLILGSVFSYTLVVMALIHSFGFFVINYYNNAVTMENKYIQKTIMLIIPNVFQILFSIVFIYSLPIESFNARVVGSTFGVCICAIVVYFLMMRNSNQLFRYDYWKYSLKISVPLILSTLSYTLMSQSDNLMITAFCGAKETAVYSLIYYIGFTLSGILQATNPVLQAWIFRSLDSGNISRIKIVQKWYLFLFLFLGALLLTVSPEIIKFLGPKEYWNFEYIGPFILASIIMVMYSFYTILISFLKKNKYIAFTVFLAALLNVLLNYIFIPIFGGIAAAVVSAISYFVLLVSLGVISKKLYQNVYSIRYIVFALAFSVILVVIFELVHSILWLRYSVFGIIILLMIIFAIIKKEEIINMGLMKVAGK